MQPNLVMGMLSSGCSSAIVLNIGHSSSQAMCFVNNRPLIHTWKGQLSRLHKFSFTAQNIMFIYQLVESVVGVSHALEDFFQHMLNNNIVSDRATAEKMFYDEARASLNVSVYNIYIFDSNLINRVIELFDVCNLGFNGNCANGGRHAYTNWSGSYLRK